MRLRKPTIVGVVNVTPDSFSDGGNFFSATDAIARVGQLFDEGADVVELGGESTRPGAQAVSIDEELSRIMPVITAVRATRPVARLAVDTTKSQVARTVLQAGVSIINDVSGFRLDPELAAVCAEARCTVVLMHSRGVVSDMARYDHATYAEGNVMPTIIRELRESLDRAHAAGVPHDDIVLDPGIGFAKRFEHSVEALAHLRTLAQVGYPVMIGVSRKRFLGEITGVTTPADRDDATIGANVAALALGASWFRVHDVRAHRHALDVAFEILHRAV